MYNAYKGLIVEQRERTERLTKNDDIWKRIESFGYGLNWHKIIMELEAEITVLNMVIE